MYFVKTYELPFRPENVQTLPWFLIRDGYYHNSFFVWYYKRPLPYLANGSGDVPDPYASRASPTSANDMAWQ